MTYKNATTAKRLRELFDCDPETGGFTCLVSRGNAVKAGDRAGCENSLGYIVIMVDGVLYRAHRLVWLYIHGKFPDGDLDHINGNKADNRIGNLRLATQSQNNANACRRKDNTSGHKGVDFVKRRAHRPDPWRARIGKDRKRIDLGFFVSQEKAFAARVAAARRLFGDFARAS